MWRQQVILNRKMLYGTTLTATGTTTRVIRGRTRTSTLSTVSMSSNNNANHCRYYDTYKWNGSIRSASSLLLLNSNASSSVSFLKSSTNLMTASSRRHYVRYFSILHQESNHGKQQKQQQRLTLRSPYNNSHNNNYYNYHQKQRVAWFGGGRYDDNYYDDMDPNFGEDYDETELGDTFKMDEDYDDNYNNEDDDDNNNLNIRKGRGRRQQQQEQQQPSQQQKKQIEREEREQIEQERQAVRDELDSRTGRGWSDPWDIQPILEQGGTPTPFKDLPDFHPKYVSRVSAERVRIHKDKVPTLQQVMELTLHGAPQPHPGLGQTKSYALYRQRKQYQYVYEQISTLAKPIIEDLLLQINLSWDEKQDKIDELFENLEFHLKDQEIILGKHPKFGKWVETALEEYLRVTVQKHAEQQQQQQKEQQQLEEKGDEGEGKIEQGKEGEGETDPLTLATDTVPIQEESQQQVEKPGQGIEEDYSYENVVNIFNKLQPSSNEDQNGNIDNSNHTAANMEEEWMGSSNVDGATTGIDDATADDTPPPIPVPIFIDCYDETVDQPTSYDLKTFTTVGNPVPKILHPLSMKQTCSPGINLPTVGSMVEEWECAAAKTTKRIMLRNCTQKITTVLCNTLKLTNSDEIGTTEDDTNISTTDLAGTASLTPIRNDNKNKNSKTNLAAKRIVITGRRGVGKTATLASVVACARKSNCIVLYIPDSNRLRKHGYYIEPNDLDANLYDLPNLSVEVITSFLSNHEQDLIPFSVPYELIEQYATPNQIKRINKELALTLPTPTTDDDNDGATSTSPSQSLPLVDLLNVGLAKKRLAPVCYSILLNILMNQTERDFLIVVDEFNCFLDPVGHYFHGQYHNTISRDPMTNEIIVGHPKTLKSIPYNQITLFKPFLDAMDLSIKDMYVEDEFSTSNRSKLMKRGAMIVAMTESHAVPQKVTKAIIEQAKVKQMKNEQTNIPVDESDSNIYVCEVPRFSKLEVEHILANFECTGIGKLRLDQGDTITNEQEVEYLRMVSGGVGQKLFDATMISG